MSKMNEVIIKHKYLCEYNYWGGYEDFKKKYLKQQNEWRKLSLETLKEVVLNENFDNTNRNKVIQLIQNNQFEIGNNQAFFNASQKSTKKEMLSNYSPQEYKDMKTFLLKGYDIGYAIKPDGDIVSVFNNSGIPNIGQELVKSAIKNGGSKLDHYDGFLSSLYEPLGFKEYHRDKWDDKYHVDDN